MRSILLALLIIAPAAQAQQCVPKQLGGTGVNYVFTPVDKGMIYTWYCKTEPHSTWSTSPVQVKTEIGLRKLYVESGYAGTPLFQAEIKAQLEATKP